MKLKKLLILLSVVSLTLTACGNDDSQLSTDTTTATVSEPTEESNPDYDKQPEDYLPDNLKDIENKTEEEIEEIFQEMEKENFEKFVEEQQKVEQQQQQQSTPSQPDTSENQTEPEFKDGEAAFDINSLNDPEDTARMEQAIENAPNIEVSQEEIDQFIKSNQ